MTIVSRETDHRDREGIYVECPCGFVGWLIPIGYDGDEVVVVCPQCKTDHQEPRWAEDDGCRD